MSVTLNELDSHLFKCADIIRNTVDKTDYKDYILPLVFYKAISDTRSTGYTAFRVVLDSGEEVDIRWRDLRPPIDESSEL